MSIVCIILLMWLATYPSRILGLMLAKLELPEFWLNFLKFVPVSVFSALIVPDVLGSPEWAKRILACAAGGILVHKTRNLAVGILGGFTAYWIARVLGI